MWKTLIAIRYFLTKKNNLISNYATKLSIFVQTFTIGILILIFSIFQGYEKKIIENMINEKGHIKIFKSTPFSIKEIERKIHLEYKTNIDLSSLILNEKINFPITIHANSDINIKNNSDLIPIVIDAETAKLLNYKINDTLKLLIPVPIDPPFYIDPLIIECQITQISSQNSPFKNILMNMIDLQNILQISDFIYSIQCKTDTKNVDFDTKKLKKVLPDFRVLTWKDLNSFSLKILNTEKNICKIIIFFLFLLSFLIYSLAIGLFIFSKKNEIKILKILKITRRDLIYIFSFYAFICSFISSIFGCIIGIILSKNINLIINFLEKLLHVTIFNKDVFIFNSIPIFIDIYSIFSIIFITFFCSIISATIFAYNIFSIDVF